MGFILIALVKTRDVSMAEAVAMMTGALDSFAWQVRSQRVGS